MTCMRQVEVGTEMRGEAMAVVEISMAATAVAISVAAVAAGTFWAVGAAEIGREVRVNRAR